MCCTGIGQHGRERRPCETRGRRRGTAHRVAARWSCGPSRGGLPVCQQRRLLRLVVEWWARARLLVCRRWGLPVGARALRAFQPQTSRRHVIKLQRVENSRESMRLLQRSGRSRDLRIAFYCSIGNARIWPHVVGMDMGRYRLLLTDETSAFLQSQMRCVCTLSPGPAAHC